MRRREAALVTAVLAASFVVGVLSFIAAAKAGKSLQGGYLGASFGGAVGLSTGGLLYSRFLEGENWWEAGCSGLVWPSSAGSARSRFSRCFRLGP